MNGPSPGAGRNIGGYALLDRVESSATGSVWRGHDHRLGRDVALKQVAAGAVRSIGQLRDEARMLARLSHPNIVGVIDLIELPGELWLVEEWVAGLTLSAALRHTGRFSAVQAVGVVRGGLLGLHHAHVNRIVHGDVSPSNLLLDLTGTTKLVDFGLARPAGVVGVAGTPGYLSPEAARGLPIVPASDVYAAAAVLMLLLRGRPLFEGATPEAVLASQFRPGTPDLSDLPGTLRALLTAALSADPGNRPADGGQFLAALDQAAEHWFGPGWMTAAGVAGLVGAAVTAGAAGVALSGATTAGIAAPTVTAAMVPFQAAPPHPASTGPGAPPAPGHDLAAGRVLRRMLRSRRLLAVAAAGAAVVTTAAVLTAQHLGSPSHPVAKPLPVTTTTVAAQAASFDLHSVDWGNITVPGRACYAAHDITLRNREAELPVPGATPASGHHLGEYLGPQYGQLSGGGPMVAMLGLLCGGTGGLAGSAAPWPQLIVFDAVAGQPHVLGLFSGRQLMSSVPTGVGLEPTAVHVQNGVIVVTGSYARPPDAHCCPTGRATATISYRGGRLVVGAGTALAPSTATGSSPAAGSSPATGSSPAAAGAVGRRITATVHSGRTYVATVVAEDTVANCAANSYGSAMIAYFRQHPCPHGAGRRLVTLSFEGRVVALSMIDVDAQIGPEGDLYRHAAQLSALERRAGAGGLDDLLRGGARPAGWPAAIPADEAFVVTGEDDTIAIFDAWYLGGSTASQEPDLVALVQDLFLTSITVGPF